MSFNYLSDIWENSNKKIKEEENYREIFSPAKKFIGKKKYFDFSSNDYLGLRNNKEIIEAGYNPEVFQEFLLSKNETAQDLSSWHFPDQHLKFRTSH